VEKTLQVLNRMEADGVIERYAIGEAIASTFYVEPISTFDLDIFFAFEIEGWPVQFLPAFNPLLEEALAKSTDIQFKGTPTRVMRAEHLVLRQWRMLSLYHRGTSYRSLFASKSVQA
jgi:hypothetical protein